MAKIQANSMFLTEYISNLVPKLIPHRSLRTGESGVVKTHRFPEKPERLGVALEFLVAPGVDPPYRFKYLLQKGSAKTPGYRIP